MVNWAYTSGHLEARNHAGTLLLAIRADSSFALMADILNAKPAIGLLLLHGYGVASGA